ncbi:hypothetical protein BJV74DRAFT_862545 [Russula compacta]|nr:hypothetical protein BJV74DRAFT_862545 [Russula compacta]
MLINKRETSSTHCTPISPSIRVCWVDLVVLSLIFLVFTYIFLGVPLTARLRRMLRRKRNGLSPSFGTVLSSHDNPSQHNYQMSSRRRQDSQETLLDGLANIGDDKSDCHCTPLDPFLVVRPSLNDSVLVKQGLVEETTLPPPTHSAHDVQGPPSQVGRSDNTFEMSSRTRSRSSTNAILLPPKKDTPISSLKESRVTKDTKCGECCEAEPSGDVVPLPPPAYTPFSVGQGRHHEGGDVGVYEVMGLSN